MFHDVSRPPALWITSIRLVAVIPPPYAADNRNSLPKRNCAMTAATNLDNFRSLLKTVDPASLTNADNRAMLLLIRQSVDASNR